MNRGSFGKMCHGEFCVGPSFLLTSFTSPKPKISLISIACSVQQSETVKSYRKRSKSAPDATLVEEVDHGVGRGNLGLRT